MLPALIGAAGGVAGSLIGAGAAGSAREEAQRLIQESVNDLKAIGIPSEEAMRLSLERYKSAGVLTPEMEQDILQGRTELEGIQTDPRLQDAQMAALNEMRSIGESGGLRLSDRAALEDVMGGISQAERGSREAILMDQAQRGATTGGGSLAAQLLNQQESANRAHSAGLNTAANAQDRALQAIMQSGQLAGNLRGQQFGEQKDIRSAQDVINAMNTQARLGVQQRNVGAKNMAQQYNLGQAQDISNANVDLANKEQTYNRSLPQQTFENQLARGGMLANARAGQASNIAQGGRDQAAMWGGIGSMAQKTGTGIYAQQSADELADKQLKAKYPNYQG